MAELDYLAQLMGMEFDESQFDYFLHSYVRSEFASDPPAQTPTATTDGGKLGWYAARKLGAAVQFGYDTEKSFLNIIRPISPDELTEALERKTEEQE